MARVTDMTKGKPAALLISFAFPLLLGNLGQQLYMIVDAIIVGRGVGVKALAAVGATDWTYWLFLWVIQALTQGFATRISIHYGERNFARLRKDVGMSVFLCVGAGIFLTVISMVSAGFMLRVLKTPEDIFDGAYAYLITMLAGTLIVMAYNMVSAILRAFGDGKTPLVAMGIAASTNIVLDLLFVLGFHLGIVGAAVATLIAQLISFLYCFFVLKKMDFLKMQPKDWSWDGRVVADLCMLGLPLALQNILIAIGGMILQSTINSQGILFVAGFTATNKIYGLLESSAFALNFATTTYISQNYGAGHGDRIHKGVKSATLIGLAMSVCVAVLMVLSGRTILQLFVDSSDGNASEVLAIAYRYLVVMSSLLFTLYLLHIYRSVLQGLGNGVGPMVSGIIEFVMRVTAALVFTRIWGSGVIFFAEPMAWAGAAAFVIVACLWKLKKIPDSKRKEQG
ncbi:MATE family efflux transporter [Lachnoclostridium sp. An14]|uniref:MATE family efflux transporter n=1 Tax=Lachnoclostridium sp. An14 TaxID=1965562 RepID=UPI001FA83760|nr:MATE family efflux transporter [Lachnoclostridium sp. An14]